MPARTLSAREREARRFKLLAAIAWPPPDPAWIVEYELPEAERRRLLRVRSIAMASPRDGGPE